MAMRDHRGNPVRHRPSRPGGAIGERLFITERTVEKHVNSIFEKLLLPMTADDHRRILAALAYLRAAG